MSNTNNNQNEKNNLVSIESTNILETDKEKNSNENKNNQPKTKKHVTFTKPVYTIIDVESYKKLNEDISETRFYYVADKKDDNNDHARANCSCNIF